MKIKISNATKKALPIGLFLLASGLSLSACSNKPSPLMVASRHDAGTFLAEASAYAQGQLGLPKGTYGQANAYGECMEGKASNALCQSLYEKMLAYAKGQKEFQNLSLKGLTDATTWAKLKDSYEAAVFDGAGS